MSKSICFIAGETSGDQNAAGVCRELKHLASDIQLWGAAGPQMQAEGCECLIDLTQVAVVGLVEVAHLYFRFLRIRNQLLAEIFRRKPDAVVLTDFAGFNLRFARALRNRGYRGKIIYFVSPQVWASRAGRAQTLAETCDKLLCLFEFEKAWYVKNASQLCVEWVGHPLVERLQRKKSELKSQPSENLLALLPGSRRNEVRRLWHAMVDAGIQVQGAMPECSAIVAAASRGLSKELNNANVQVVVGETAHILQRARLAVVASGTATLECAFFGCPMIVVYRVAWPTYFAARALIRVPCIAMPNILAGRQIVPELIQNDCTAEKIAAMALDLLQNSQKREEQRVALAELIKKLGPPGASQRAAKAILATL